MRKSLLSLLLILCLKWVSFDSQAAGLTIVTHGFRSNTTGWVTNMAKAIGNYYGANTDFAVYRVKYLQNIVNDSYYPAVTDFAGTIPTNSSNCEIIVLLDWGIISGDIGSVLFGVPFTTAPIASSAMTFLSSPGSLPHIGNRSALELPIHLIGHSRGGSMVCELARLMGEQGLWVDQVTTIDPHPLNNGFDDSFVTAKIDPDAIIFENVLFADNYYQVNNSFLGLDPSGKSIFGAYNRYLVNYSGMGYLGTARQHANTHLWYHGAIDSQTPTTDGEAVLDFDERVAWYTEAESINITNQFLRGANAGYVFSRVGGGERNSKFTPAPNLSNEISDGLHSTFASNKPANRTPLLINQGDWPNLTHVVSQTNAYISGSEFRIALAYQYARSTNEAVQIALFLDKDKNPLNGFNSVVGNYSFPATTRNLFGVYQLSLFSDPIVTYVGTNYLCATISANNQVRYLYQESPILITASRLPPELEIVREVNGAVHLGVQGYPQQEVIVEVSTDLALWIPIGTNTIETTTVEFTDTQAPLSTQCFYRAKLATP